MYSVHVTFMKIQQINQERRTNTGCPNIKMYTGYPNKYLPIFVMSRVIEEVLHLSARLVRGLQQRLQQVGQVQHSLWLTRLATHPEIECSYRANTHGPLTPSPYALPTGPIRTSNIRIGNIQGPTVLIQGSRVSIVSL